MSRRWAQAMTGRRPRMTATSTEIAGISQPEGGERREGGERGGERF